jgi:hypothetical protein
MSITWSASLDAVQTGGKGGGTSAISRVHRRPMLASGPTVAASSPDVSMGAYAGTESPTTPGVGLRTCPRAKKGMIPYIFEIES